jgi:hypothetical protein
MVLEVSLVREDIFTTPLSFFFLFHFVPANVCNLEIATIAICHIDSTPQDTRSGFIIVVRLIRRVESSTGIDINQKNAVGVPVVLVGYNEEVWMHFVVFFAGLDVMIVDVSECATRKVWLSLDPGRTRNMLQSCCVENRVQRRSPAESSKVKCLRVL